MNLFPSQGEILVCTGCGQASNVMIRQSAVACCPDSNYQPCPHKVTSLRVLNVEAGCETTATCCTICNEQLTDSKTDCR